MLRHRFRPRLFAIALLVVSVAAGVALHLLGPRPPEWYPPCMFQHVTGLHCPGCGSGRAMHALAHGDLATAWQQNAWTILLLPLLGAWCGAAVWRGLRHNRAAAPPPRGTALNVLIVTLAFTLARNLPWWPLTVLAPDRVAPAPVAMQQDLEP